MGTGMGPKNQKEIWDLETKIEYGNWKQYVKMETGNKK